MKDKTYNILKWVLSLGLYGLSVLVTGLNTIWGIPYADSIVKTIDLVGTVLGIWFGISCYTYYKSTKNVPNEVKPLNENDVVEDKSSK